MKIRNNFLEEVILPKEFQQRASYLENAGVDCSEIELLVNLKVDREISVYCD